MQFGREVVFAVLLTALLCVTDAQEDGNFTICEPVNGSLANPAVPFPSFPSQFSLQIEFTSSGQNSTSRLVEYYDGVGQRGRLDFWAVDSRFTLISDFTTEQAFHMMYDEGRITNCTVVPLEEDRATNVTFHEIPGPNGTLQIGSANDLLHFAGELKDQEVYFGQEFMRGVLTDHWQYCFASENATFLLDYYFAVEGWGFPLNASRVPILATLFGHYRLPSGEFEAMDNTYTFSAFDPSPIGDDVFTVPEGVVCKNRKNLKPLPFLDGVKFFSSISQTTNVANRQTSNYLFYYDRQANLVRYDLRFQNQSQPGSAPSRISVIHDFTQGVQYWINRDDGSCNVSNLNDSDFHSNDVVVDDQGNYVLASLFHLFSPYNNSASAYVYEGASTVRGIDAEAWLAFILVADSTYPLVTLENVTNLVYFTRDSWVVNGRNTTQMLRLRIRGTAIWNDTVVNQFDVISDVFSSDPEEPPFEVFDAFVCFPPDQTREVMFTLPVLPTANALSLLRSNIRTSLSSFTGSPGSQFGNIQIQTYSPDSVVVNLLLHDPPNAGYMNGTRKSSQTLLNEISAGISNGSLMIHLSDGTMVSPHSLQQPCPSPSPTPSTTQALSTASNSSPDPTSGSIINTAPMPTASPSLSPNPSLITPSQSPSSTSMSSSSTSMSPSSNPEFTPAACPSSDGTPNIAAVVAGSFFGGFIACLLVGLVVAGIILAIRAFRKVNSYKVNYSQQLDDM